MRRQAAARYLQTLCLHPEMGHLLLSPTSSTSLLPIWDTSEQECLWNELLIDLGRLLCGEHSDPKAGKTDLTLMGLELPREVRRFWDPPMRGWEEGTEASHPQPVRTRGLLSKVELYTPRFLC